MVSKDYVNYSARDFASDEEFQQWVLHPGVKNIFFWKTWISQHPEKSETITLAIALVRSVRFPSYSLTAEEKNELWDEIWDNSIIDELEPDHPVSGSKKSPRLWKRIAAAAVILVGCVGLWRIATLRPAHIASFSLHTAAGEVKQVILPDSSKVLMNANSSLVYTGKKGRVRDVWLEGEAYFDVKHTLDQQPFIVHTYDHVSIDVLGTQFTVNSFGSRISVVLQKGKVRLSISEKSGNTQLYLKPGEQLNYDKQSGDYSKSNTDLSGALSWTRGILTMNNYSLDDATAFMQNIFNKKMIIRDKQLLKDSVSGSMPIVYNVDTMLMQFAKVFQVKFKQKESNEIWVFHK